MNRKGYTLVEMMVTVAILLTVLGPLTVAFNFWYKNFFIDNSTVYLEQEIRDIMESILTDLRKNADNKTVVFVSEDEKTLSITNDPNDINITYKFDLPNQILKNGTNILENKNYVVDGYFKVNEGLENGEEASGGYSSKIINIYIKLKSEQDVEVELKSTYRIRLTSLY